MASVLKSFYFVLFTLTVVVSAAGISPKCKSKIGGHRGKIVKKIRNGQTALKDTYKYAGLMRFTLDRRRRGTCSGAFVSYSECHKCAGTPTKYYFITAAHCFNDSVTIPDVRFGLSKKSPFFTVRGGFLTLYFGSFGENYMDNSSIPMAFQELFLEPQANLIRIPLDFKLNLPTNTTTETDSDVAIVELSKLQYDDISTSGGDFIKGETNAYVKDYQTGDECVFVSMSGDTARYKGAQIAPMKKVGKKDCLPNGVVSTRKREYECWGILVITAHIQFGNATAAEHGDSGSPIICKRDGKEVLMSLFSSSYTKFPFVAFTPPKVKMRDLLRKAYYDDAVYNYFPPDHIDSAFVASEQTGYIHDELKH